MTNKKLCTLIQEGQKEYLPDLWHQTKRFGAAQARKYFFSLGNLGGVDLEDLLQSRYDQAAVCFPVWCGSGGLIGIHHD